MRDPRRRNRNIGTSKQGHGDDNEMVIPRWWDLHERVYYAQLKKPVRVGKCNLTFLVEPTLEDHFHPTTPYEIMRVLANIPNHHQSPIKTIVLHQPTRKQAQLRPVWGRLAYYLELGRFSGPAIILDAQTMSAMSWGTRLNPREEEELERLTRDGHEVTVGKRDITISVTPESLRSTQLFHTLPHEIGHYVDYMQKVVWKSQETGDSEERLWELYRSRPSQECEDFAIRYAEEARSGLPIDGWDAERRTREAYNDQLEPRWFLPSTGQND